LTTILTKLQQAQRFAVMPHSITLDMRENFQISVK